MAIICDIGGFRLYTKEVGAGLRSVDTLEKME